MSLTKPLTLNIIKYSYDMASPGIQCTEKTMCRVSPACKPPQDIPQVLSLQLLTCKNSGGQELVKHNSEQSPPGSVDQLPAGQLVQLEHIHCLLPLCPSNTAGQGCV